MDGESDANSHVWSSNSSQMSQSTASCPDNPDPTQRDPLEKKTKHYLSLDEFVSKSGGTRVIEKILIANNGIAAVKCMRSLRKWAYATFHNADALVFVCMATPEDIHANAEYIKMANKTVMVPGGSNPNNYANVELILQTAVTNGVDAVWAGWGHASENPQLPEVLAKNNIAFLGPSHYAMWALGDKVAATILAQSADVPTLPWSGSNLRITLPEDAESPEPDVGPQNCDNDCHQGGDSLSAADKNGKLNGKHNGSDSNAQIQFYLDRTPTANKTKQPRAWAAPTTLISEDLYYRGCVTDFRSCQICAERIGYPVMIKAAEGGGGKGIRKVTSASELARYFPQVQSEVPGSPIFLMKCAQKARHLEVQLLADQYGQAISLFGRDCSIQRRHQKIIEEAPIVVAPKATIEAMERAAVRLSKLVGYVSAGTVEYLYDPSSDQFYFLELNPRLQVEHPCTEVVAEVNLPACQLQIAMGIPLHRIKDIRELYKVPVYSDSPIEFDALETIRRPPSCYVIAARITSEDPDEGFKPRPGDVQELNFKSSQCVWGYFSVGSAGGIHEFADSQFGHCFSAAESREQARENLVLALKELSIRGDFRTTVEYLIKIMESDAFMNHQIDTDWLDMRITQKDQVEKPDLLLGVVCTALHIADRRLRQLIRNYELHLERGQFLPSNTLTNCADVVLVSDFTKFVVKVLRTGPSSFHIISNNSLLGVEVYRMSADGLLICHELASYMTYCHEDSQGYRTVINNRTMAFAKETDPSVLRSHSNGKLLQFTVADGDHVCENEVYALIEVMKLVLELRVPASGRITLKRIPGAVLEPGAELACLQLDDPTQLKSLELYKGPLILPRGSHASTQCVPPNRQSELGVNESLPTYLSAFDSVNLYGKKHNSVVSFQTKDSDTHTPSPTGFVPLPGTTESPTFGLHSGLSHHSQSTSSLIGPCGRKLHHNFCRVLASLEQVLLGYALPMPFFTPWLRQNLEQLMTFLHDPHLPLLELQETIAHLAGRLPPTMERALRALAKLYAGQVTSVMANFPSSHIIRLVETHLTEIRRGTHFNSQNVDGALSSSADSQDPEVIKFEQTVQRLVDLAERYKNGLRGHTIHVLSQLLLGYVVVERHFQHGQYDTCTRQLLARCHNGANWNSDPLGVGYTCEAPESSIDEDEDDVDEGAKISASRVSPALQSLIQPRTVGDIVAVVFSHGQLEAKNALIIGLIDMLTERRELSMACDLKDSLKAITELSATGNSKVSLSARHLLISMQTPPYEVRRNQVESVFLSAVDTFGQQFHPECLSKLITAETVVFDILTDFFYHPNPTVASAALEVYIRRSYAVCELTSIQHVQLPSGASFLPFRFTLPQAQLLVDGHDRPHTGMGSDLNFSAKEQADESSTNMCECPSEAFTYQLSEESPNLKESMGLKRKGPNAKPYVMHDRSRSLAQASFDCIERSALCRGLTATSSTLAAVHERIGGMAAFNSLEELEEAFDEIIDAFAAACTEAKTVHSSLSEPSLFNFGRGPFMYALSQKPSDPTDTLQSSSYQTNSLADEPVHILNIALRHSEVWSETRSLFDGPLFHQSSGPFNSYPKGQRMDACQGAPSICETDDINRLETFCCRHITRLRSLGIGRITFLIVKNRQFPKYYTFRARDNYHEDRVYRHLEPALAFQLELNRMRNYELERLPTVNRRMHLYLGKGKILMGKAAKDYRFFLRCIIRHADLSSREACLEFLQSETERTLLEAMDALELAQTHPDACHTMGNHIFLNFLPTLLLDDIGHLKCTIRKTVLRYARRILRLRVSQAEIKMCVRFRPSEPAVPIRIALQDEQAYALGLNIYKEVLDPSSGELLLWSIGLPRGPLHGQPAGPPHENKDYLQIKRYQARKFNTTYVYDYPKLVLQALMAIWKIYRPESELTGNPSPHLFSSRNGDGIRHEEGRSHSERKKLSPTLKEECAETVDPFKHQPRVQYPSLSSIDDLDDEFVLSCTELAVGDDSELHPIQRTPGSNTVGMVVWHMVLRTPDTPSGRSVIVIANDATCKAGSFGPAEDLTFHRGSQLARQLGVPRIYLASNTGARIGVAEDVKALFRVAWVDPAHPAKGYNYLYLSSDDYEQLKECEAVNCEKIEVDGEIRYKIVDIVGKEHDMSVENLRGSAMIAGETSLAYDDIFTITIVTNRAIGIGAYLARLGQRVIQVKNSHIILTGAMALNKLLGREVYTSNSQLGGVQVMANNGVSHLVAADELLALQQALEWLTFIPSCRGRLCPLLYRPVPINMLDESINLLNNSKCPEFINLGYIPFDPIDRPVVYEPCRDRPNDDPRWMFTGVHGSHLNVVGESAVKRPVIPSIYSPAPSSNRPKSDGWLSGFFDWGTWKETLAAWAAGVVVGRARLGGIPCGVITSETRSVTFRVPADPANLSTEAQVVNQAGQVWYPDSAYKTAQAIADFAREKLPLIIFANWRGFSGGMKDMYDQVLKFGSMIIDALCRYPLPVFVYLPPQSQLRGGAWVVVDPAINPDRIEMYADPVSCRAGVLEPEGTVEIKYRKADLIKTMLRLDDQCRRLVEEINRLQTGGPASNDLGPTDPTLSIKDRIRRLQSSLETRQKKLIPLYQQVACTFADLHDTPGRLLTRHLVHGLIPWSQSRTFFYYRLRRRLLEMQATRLINDILPSTWAEDCDLLNYLKNSSTFTTMYPNSAPTVENADKSGTETADRITSPSDVSNGDPVVSSIGKKGCHSNRKLPDNSPFAFTPDEIAKEVPRLAICKNPELHQVLSLLRKWFIHNKLEEMKLKKCSPVHNGKGESQRTGSNKKSEHRMTYLGKMSTQNPVSAPGVQDEPKSDWHTMCEQWENDDLTVGDWLTRQFRLTSPLIPVPIQANLMFWSEVQPATSDLADENNQPDTFVKQEIEAIKKHCILSKLRETLAHSRNKPEELANMLSEVLPPGVCTRLAELLEGRLNVVPVTDSPINVPANATQ